MEIIKKVVKVINSAWFGAAASLAAGAFVLMYGYKLYAGLLIGWAANSAFKWLKDFNSTCKCNCECCKSCDKCNG